MKKIILFIMSLLFITSVYAEELSIAKNAKSAVLIENTTGRVLYKKNMNEKRSPASMTKIMTLLITMESLDSGRISLEDEVMISKHAASMGGTQIFLNEGKKVSVETLLKGITIASANDAAVAIAEYISGSEEAFVNIMNEKAKELGCKNTQFKNPHGLDEDGHYSSAYDMALMSRELLKYPRILKLTSTYEDYIDVNGENHWLVNTNKLIRFYSGIDGLKTGYTDNALYCLTATMERNNMRLISVVMGESNKEARNTDTINMMEYGFSNYGAKKLFDKNKPKGSIRIYNANNKKVEYYTKGDVNLIVNKNNSNVKYKLDEEIYNNKAPLEKNSRVGKLTLKYDGNVFTYDLIIKEDINKPSFVKTFVNMFKNVISGIKYKD